MKVKLIREIKEEVTMKRRAEISDGGTAGLSGYPSGSLKLSAVEDEDEELLEAEAAAGASHKRVRTINSRVLHFSGDKYLEAIEFSSNITGEFHPLDTQLPPIYVGAESWRKIPKFSVITGQNGSGKSALLKYINHNITVASGARTGASSAQPALSERRYLLESEILYIDPGHRLDNLFNSSSSDNTSDLIDRNYDKCLEQVFAHYNGGAGIELIASAKEVIRRIDLDQAKPEVVAKEYIGDVISSTIEHGLNDLRLKEPITFLGLICRGYDKRIEANSRKATELSGVSKLYRTYYGFEDEEVRDLHAKGRIGEGKLSLEMFLRAVAENAEFRKAVVDKVSIKQAGIDPLVRMNKILSEYGFRYEVMFSKGSKASISEKKLWFKRGEHEIEAGSLSSGEITILSVMTWMFAVNGLSSTGEEHERQIKNSLRVILLDEPDRHFDPKLSKIFFDIIYNEIVKANNVQVLMTTHRPDSIALMPETGESGIFTIERNDSGALRIAPTTKLHAMFRITRNLRELTNLHTKVYVEAHEDARFYEAVYKSLMTYCDEVREENQAKAGYGVKPSRYWAGVIRSNDGTSLLDSEAHTSLDVLRSGSRVLSNRYRLSFYSAAFEEGASGGCRAVEDLMRRDIASREVHRAISGVEPDVSMEAGGGVGGSAAAASAVPVRMAVVKARYDFAGWLHRETLEINKPFAIIDGDYAPYKFGLVGRDFQKRFSQLPRHSLENFLFDPFIVISSGNLGDIAEPLRTVCTNLQRELSGDKSGLQRCLDDYFSTLIFDCCKAPKEESIYKEVKKKKWYFGDTEPEEKPRRLAEQILNKVRSLEIGSSYDREVHFAELFRDDADARPYKKQFEALCDLIKPELMLQYRVIEHFRSRSRDINGYGSREIGVILGKDSVIQVKYPRIFLELRGHDIGGVFPIRVGASRDGFKEELLKSLGSGGLYIPVDLAAVFFEINEKVRSQGNKFVKPDDFRSRVMGERREAELVGGAGTASSLH